MATKKSAAKSPAKTAAKAPAKAAAKSAPAKTPAKAAEKTPAKAAAVKTPPTHQQIADLAHKYFVERGHSHGSHVDDWLRAEKELTA